jgi:pyruvate,water dikinase
MKSIKHFSEIGINDIPLVGGKNASLGEMYISLSSKGILVPEGFALTSKGYWQFLNENNLTKSLEDLLATLDIVTFHNLSEIGSTARELVLNSKFPEAYFQNRYKTKSLKPIVNLSHTLKLENRLQFAVAPLPRICQPQVLQAYKKRI